MNSKTRSVITPVVLFIMALSVRLLYISHFKATPFYNPEATGLDMLLFDKLAQSIASGDWLGSGVFELMPGYGYLLGILYSLIGRDLTAAYALQAILGAGTVVLIYWLTKRLTSEGTALLAAAISILSQPLVFHTGMLTGEQLTVFLTVAFLLLLSIAVQKSNLWIFLTAGILAGLGTLCRGTFALVIILFIPWHLILEKRHLIRLALPQVVALLLGTVIIIAPVTIRNYVLADDFVLITAHDGINIYLGNNPHAHGAWQPLSEIGVKSRDILSNSKEIAETSLGRQLKPSQVSSYWKKRAFKFIRSQPRRFLGLAGEKLLFFFNAFEVSDVIPLPIMKRFSWLLKYCLIPFGIIMPLAVLGMAISFRRRGYAMLYLFIAANLIAVIMTLVNSRYRLPSIPILIIFAATSLVWLKDNIQSKKRLLFATIILMLSTLMVYMPISARDIPEGNISNLAKAYLAADNDTLAEIEFRRAVELNPNYIDARFGLGFILWKQRRVNEAKEQFEAVVAIDPKHYVSLNQLGNISLFKDDNAKALEYWERSLAINPDQPDVRNAIKHNRLK